MMNRLLSSVVVLLSLLACTSDGSPSPPAAQKAGAEKPPTKDARWTIAFSKDGLTINGSRVQLNRTTKQELEKLLGPLDRTFRLEICRDPIGFWDKQGIRIFFSKDTGVVDYLDCAFVVGEYPDLQPRQPFTGVLRVDGVEVSKKTTKAAIQGKVSGKVFDSSFDRPDFYVVHPPYDASFTLSKDGTVLQMVRFSARP
jgi:hypothetical protein